MPSAKARYSIGIDLGTTNCALAYADTQEATADAPAPIQPLAIPQLVGINDETALVEANGPNGKKMKFTIAPNAVVQIN